MVRRFFVIMAFVALSATRVDAQAAALDSVSNSLRQLFTAMQNKDTAAVRASFTANGRVLPISEIRGRTTPPALSVDQFVEFVAKGTAPWIERMFNLDVRATDVLAFAWFNYDVHLGDKVSHHGVNAVQLARSDTGWKIVSMAFTSKPGIQ